MIEAAIEHGENNSHIALAPNALRDVINRISRSVGNPEAPVIAIASSGSRFFLRQIVESAVWNLYFISHNEIPPGIRVQSLGVIT